MKTTTATHICSGIGLFVTTLVVVVVCGLVLISCDSLDFSDAELRAFAVLYFSNLQSTNVAGFMAMIPEKVRLANDRKYPSFFLSIFLSDVSEYAHFLTKFDPKRVSVRRQSVVDSEQETIKEIRAFLDVPASFEKVLFEYEVEPNERIHLQRLVGKSRGVLFLAYSPSYAESLPAVCADMQSQGRVHGDVQATISAALQAAVMAADQGDFKSAVQLLRPVVVVAPTNADVKQLLYQYEKALLAEERRVRVRPKK